jgi:hypothetical protein
VVRKSSNENGFSDLIGGKESDGKPRHRDDGWKKLKRKVVHKM